MVQNSMQSVTVTELEDIKSSTGTPAANEKSSDDKQGVVYIDLISSNLSGTFEFNDSSIFTVAEHYSLAIIVFGFGNKNGAYIQAIKELSELILVNDHLRVFKTFLFSVDNNVKSKKKSNLIDYSRVATYISERFEYKLKDLATLKSKEKRSNVRWPTTTSKTTLLNAQLNKCNMNSCLGEYQHVNVIHSIRQMGNYSKLVWPDREGYDKIDSCIEKRMSENFGVILGNNEEETTGLPSLFKSLIDNEIDNLIPD